MIDDKPYIIVDNRKIAPIERSSRTGQPTDGRNQSDDQPFGVIDRVTISKEARERFRQKSERSDQIEILPVSSPLLTYTPKPQPDQLTNDYFRQKK